MSARADPSTLRLAAGFAIGAALLVGGVLLLLNTLAQASGNSDPRIGTSPDFSLPDLDGNAVRLSDFRGKPVLVNLWASWCAPCKAELPELIAFYDEHKAEGLVVLAVATMDDEEAARAFLREWRLPFVIPWDPQGKVVEQLGARGLPTSFIFNRGGVLRLVWNGPFTKATLDQRVAPIVGRE